MATTHTHHSDDQTTAGTHHEPGTMDVTAQERTFDGFIRMLTWNTVAIIAIVIFLALTNA